MIDNKPAKSGRRWRSSFVAVALAIVLIAAITLALRARVASMTDPPAKAPLPVAAVTYELQDGYERSISYLGVITAGRKANLAFEVPGQIAALNVRQGSAVESGEVIATLDDARLQASRRAAAANLDQAKSELELGRLKAKRQQDLVASGSVSKEAYDETRLRAQALQARVESITAQLAGIDIDLENSRLIAPYGGVIADRYMNEGAVVNAGVAVVRLVETASKEAHIGVVAERAVQLRQGEIYTLTLREETIPATLMSVRPDIDPITRVATAVFAIPDSAEPLDGEPVYLNLKETIALRGGWLPVTALLEGERGMWTVLRLDDGGEHLVTVREGVEVLEVRGDRAYVIGTLQDRARVVSRGVHRVVPNTPVAETGSP